MEPFFQEVPLCFSIMRKSASHDFRIVFISKNQKRLMLKHTDTSSKKGSFGRVPFKNIWSLPAKRLLWALFHSIKVAMAWAKAVMRERADLFGQACG